MRCRLNGQRAILPCVRRIEPCTRIGQAGLAHHDAGRERSAHSSPDWIMRYAGTDAGVDWTCDIATEIANELGIKPKIALLYSEQSPDSLSKRNDQGKTRPLPPA